MQSAPGLRVCAVSPGPWAQGQSAWVHQTCLGDQLRQVRSMVLPVLLLLGHLVDDVVALLRGIGLAVLKDGAGGGGLKCTRRDDESLGHRPLTVGREDRSPRPCPRGSPSGVRVRESGRGKRLSRRPPPRAKMRRNPVPLPWG